MNSSLCMNLYKISIGVLKTDRDTIIPQFNIGYGRYKHHQFSKISSTESEN